MGLRRRRSHLRTGQPSACRCILSLWACVACLNGRLSFARCPVTGALGGTCSCLARCNLFHLPPGWILKIVSPERPRHRTRNCCQPNPSSCRRRRTATAAGASARSACTRTPRACDLFHWLEVLLLFAVVRHQLASTASMRRLAIVALLTGVAISLFGLFQTFRYGGHNVYGFDHGRQRIWAIHQSQSRRVFSQSVHRLGNRPAR